jgi:Ras-related protein Rab-8A
MEQNDNKTKIDIKIITLGDSHVGKSCLIVKYIENRFSISYASTIGFDLKHKQIILKDGNKARLTLFDTAGQERFRSLAKNYIRKANGILLVYDISDKLTFISLGKWMENIKEELGDKLPIILVGNKTDLKEKREVSTEEGKKKAKEYGFPFYETSCKTGDNVNECFIELAELVYENIGNKPLQNSNKKIRKNSSKDKKKRCC